MTSLKKLTLVVPPLLEEEVIDRLLECDGGLEFTAGTVYAHASGHESLSLIEQVTGRKRRIRFEIVGEASELELLLQLLKARFSGSSIHYLLQPIEARGLL
jgi:hypothetical protein